ncbi:nuclease-related domain-containing protein [Negativibacillus massiliensis]|uniref:nuclease-related domain-containing protein n=1 Tax=Negativibacillus massiliensis TaxID=1871035 RepID=UPI003AF2A8A3
MNNSVIILIAVVAFCAAVFIAWYLMKNLRFTKGNYGKQTVKSILKRFAFPRKYKVLENVSMELDGKTQTIDFVMVGEFGLLFVSALQGKGDFYGDFTEEYWSFVDNEKKVRFLNPVKEMDKKLDMFRRLMAKKKVYNLKIESAVVIVGSKADAPMYLSHVGKENIVMTVNQFKKLLEKEKFEQDNNIDVVAVTDVLSNLH